MRKRQKELRLIEDQVKTLKAGKQQYFSLPMYSVHVPRDYNQLTYLLDNFRDS